MRRLLPLLVFVVLAGSAAPASAVQDLGPHPVREDCYTKYGTHETPKCFYGVEAVDFSISDHLMRPGDVASISINYGWDVNPNAFSPRHAELELGPGLQIVGGCTQSFYAPGSDHCTVIASAPTNGWVHHGYRFYFAGSYPYRSGDYYAIVSEGFEISGTIMKLNAQGKYEPAAGEEVTIKKSDGTFTETVTTLTDGTYTRLVDPGTYSVRPRDTELCREPREHGGCEHTATVTTGPDQNVSFASPDPVTISGTVTTADGEPLSGVTIHARPTGGRSRLFTTKKDGKYELKVSPGTTDIGSSDPLVCPKPVQDAGNGKCVNEKQIDAQNDVTVDFEKPGCVQKVDFENRMIAKGECIKETLKDTTWETDKKFALNGIEMEPKGRTVFDKNAQTVTFEGGAVFYLRAGDVRFVVGGVRSGYVADFTATSFSVTTDGLSDLLPGGKAPNFGKFPITAKLDLEPEAGKTTITTQLTMPGNPAAQEQFTPIRFGEWPAAKPPPLAVTVKFVTDNDNGVRSVAASVNRGFDFSVLEFTDLGIGYDIPTKIWTFTGKGGATFLKGTRTKGPTLKGTLGGTGIPFYSGVFTQLTLGLDELNRPLYGPLFIQRLGIGIDVNSVKPGAPFKFEASAGVSAGPRNPAPKKATIPGFGEVTLIPSEWLAIDGKFSVSGEAGAEDLESSKLTIALSGALKVSDKEVGTMTGKLYPFVPMLSGEASFDFPDPFGGRFFTLHGTGGIWLDARQAEFKDSYYVDFDGTSSFPGSGTYRARGAITGRGIGICFGAPGESWGWSYEWGTVSLPIPGGCDLEAFTSAKPKLRVVHSAAAANSFELTGSEGVMAVEIPGKGAVPAVTVTGPGGLKLSTDGVKFGRKGDAILMPFPGRNAAYVFLPHPKAGVYKVTPAKGTKLGKLKYAKERPATDVTGELTGPACTPTLNWKLTPQKGQQIQFVEVSSLGTRLLGDAKGRAGKLKLAPLSGGGRSEVRALVRQGSLVRDTITLGAYTAGSDGRPASPRALKVKRGKKGAGTVSWTAGCGAAAYEVKVGKAKAVMAKSPKLAVKKLPKSGAVTVTSVAADGKRGGSSRLPLN